MLQQHAHSTWVTTIIKLIIFVAYGACWVCLCRHNPPNSDMDSRIFIMCTDVNACNCTQGLRTPKESLQWKLTLGRKSLAAPRNRTCISGVTFWCSNQLSYIPSLRFAQCCFWNSFSVGQIDNGPFSCFQKRQSSTSFLFLRLSPLGVWYPWLCACK